ncbi:MAG: hypothetical protein QHI48_06610 [Bacteroidota bacterium]|nr:hypothetical protein [Bacteroidota bacterium]
MKFLLPVFLVMGCLIPIAAKSQVNFQPLPAPRSVPFETVKLDDQVGALSMRTDSEPVKRKSPFLATVYSLLLPGMGELYAGRFDRGKYPLVSEGILWAGVAGFSSWSSWVRNDARLFAAQYAGVDRRGKDDKFFSDIGNYRSTREYNAAKLVERNLAALYPEDPSAGYYWEWPDDETRKRYREQRIHGDELSNAVTFFVLGLVANRVWSAVESALFVRRYNQSFADGRTRWPFVQPYFLGRFGRIDGVVLAFSADF